MEWVRNSKQAAGTARPQANCVPSRDQPLEAQPVREKSVIRHGFLKALQQGVEALLAALRDYSEGGMALL